MAAKDFGPIASDYAFFSAHCTEAVNDAAQYARELAGFERRETFRMLDFGCGTGEFSERLLSALNWPPPSLDLTLAEPVRAQRAEAVRRLARFSEREIATVETPLAQVEPRFDAVVSNHVLYYAEDLDATLAQLVGSLAPGGRLLLAIAGWDNPLAWLWKAGFAILDRPVPYHLSEDVEAGLRQSGATFRKTQVPYRLRFPDSTENRMKILRFLFSEYLEEISAPRLLDEFDRHAAGNHIDILTQSDHFSVAGE